MTVNNPFTVQCVQCGAFDLKAEMAEFYGVIVSMLDGETHHKIEVNAPLYTCNACGCQFTDWMFSAALQAKLYEFFGEVELPDGIEQFMKLKMH